MKYHCVQIQSHAFYRAKCPSPRHCAVLDVLCFRAVTDDSTLMLSQVHCGGMQICTTVSLTE